jgi:hypothetical protein
MPKIAGRYTSEEVERLGRDLYERLIKPKLAAGDHDKFVAIDVETGEYELDSDDYAATQRLHDRQPNSQIWLERFGHEAPYRLRTPFLRKDLP